jgi:hypothetical protein
MAPLTTDAASRRWYAGAVDALYAALTWAFGSPVAIFRARVLGALARLCACPLGDAVCPATHREVAAVVAAAALNAARPDDAAAILLGAGAHETCFRTQHQADGPAVSWWQLEATAWTPEGRAAERALWLSSAQAAAAEALRRARTCRGSMVGYASGRCDARGPSA